MRVFASWSGGKDCMLALYRHLQTIGNEVVPVLSNPVEFTKGETYKEGNHIFLPLN